MQLEKIESSAGSSLIEVMVALFILGIGLLGVLGTQVRSMQMNQNAYLYSQASTLATDIYESMQTSEASIATFMTNFGDSIPGDPGCESAVANCSPAQIATWNKRNWLTNVRSLLPGGDAQIERDGATNDVVITIRFTASYDEETGDVITQEVQLETNFND